VEVRVEPVRFSGYFAPEGATAKAFSVTKQNVSSVQWGRIVTAIPLPPPKPLDQTSCSSGVNITIVFSTHRQITYGPCVRPPVIDRLLHVLLGRQADVG